MKLDDSSDFNDSNLLILDLNEDQFSELLHVWEGKKVNLHSYSEDQSVIQNALKSFRVHKSIPDIDKEAIQLEVQQYLPRFYQKNARVFHQIKDQFGIDTWFYIHFSLYFHVRNLLYFERKVAYFLNKFENGLVITSSNMWNDLDEAWRSRIRFFTSKKKPSHNCGKTIKGMLNYVKFVLTNAKKHKITQDTILINGIHTYITQNNNLTNRVFFDLVDHYPNIYQSLIPSPPDLRVKTDSYKVTRKIISESSKNGPTSESIYLKGLTIKNVIKLFNFQRAYKKGIQKIADSDSQKIDKLIIQFLKGKSGTLGMYYFQYLSYVKFFKTHTCIRKIILTDENSPQVRSVWEAGRKFGVISFAVQHGAIHAFHPAYNYQGYHDVSNILADYTLVWGKAHQHLLENFQYPQNSIHKVGQIRTDQIQQSQQDRILQWKLENNIGTQKVVCYASQPQRDTAYRERVLLEVGQACLLDNAILLIRPHPRERTEDFHTLKSIVGLKYYLDHDSDLYFHFELADLLITCFSTVGGEFAIFNKPLIIVDYLRQDIQGYIKSGIAVGAYSFEQLIELVRTSAQLNMDKEKHADFIAKYFYKIDGKVSKRIQEFVQNTGTKKG